MTAEISPGINMSGVSRQLKNCYKKSLWIRFLTDMSETWLKHGANASDTQFGVLRSITDAVHMRFGRDAIL